MSMAEAKHTMKAVVDVEVKASRRHSPRAMDKTTVAKLRMVFSFFP
jgi:hypothetical protein